MDRYSSRFRELESRGEKAFVPFTVLGWPDEERSLRIIKTMIDSGATCIELGIAFSDPVADGPVIQEASYATLESGFGVADAFRLIKRVRDLDANVPIGLLVYYNIVLSLGVETFFKTAHDAGVDGVLIADLPVESASEIAPAAEKHGIAPIFIVSPLTTEGRLDSIIENARGFLYLVSRLGVTGTGERDVDRDARLKSLVANIKEKTELGKTDTSKTDTNKTDTSKTNTSQIGASKCEPSTTVSNRRNLPVLAGFGVSSPAQAKAMLSLGVDGVITGSRIIELARSGDDYNAVLKPYLSEMVAVCREPAAQALSNAPKK